MTHAGGRSGPEHEGTMGAGGRSVSRAALRHGAAAASALAGLPLVAGLALRPRWRAGLSERFGLHPRLGGGAVWVHAASVGEIRAGSRLVDRLLDRGRPVRTSTTSLTGRAAMRGLRPRVPCHLAPADHPWCTALSLARSQPAALTLVEAELWPSWIRAARRRRIPVLLVSGRVSDRSFARQRRLVRWVGPLLRSLSAIGARTGQDAERLLALGARPETLSVSGDLKLDAEQKPPAPDPELERLLGRAPLLVAGSTHAGEEEALLAALDALEASGVAPILALAPRRPERVDEVLRLLRRSGRSWRRRTRAGDLPLQGGEVLVLDTIGDLAGLYARAALAFVGGTLAAVGGHNVIEPAGVGCPVVVGPHTGSVRHAVAILADCGALRPVPDAASLAPALGAWLRAPAAARHAGEAGRRALEEHRGSAARAASLVESVLGTPAGGSTPGAGPGSYADAT